MIVLAGRLIGVTIGGVGAFGAGFRLFGAGWMRWVRRTWTAGFIYSSPSNGP
jgi:hypothetical protein